MSPDEVDPYGFPTRVLLARSVEMPSLSVLRMGPGALPDSMESLTKAYFDIRSVVTGSLLLFVVVENRTWTPRGGLTIRTRDDTAYLHAKLVDFVLPPDDTRIPHLGFWDVMDAFLRSLEDDEGVGTAGRARTWRESLQPEERKLLGGRSSMSVVDKSLIEMSLLLGRPHPYLEPWADFVAWVYNARISRISPSGLFLSG